MRRKYTVLLSFKRIGRTFYYMTAHILLKFANIQLQTVTAHGARRNDYVILTPYEAVVYACPCALWTSLRSYRTYCFSSGYRYVGSVRL